MTPSAAPEAVDVARVKRAVRPTRVKPISVPATERPVARVAVDLPLAHLDRPFDYLVPESMHEQAVPGCRVKVRFAGRDVSGYLLERADQTTHVGQLSFLRRVVSAEPVLSSAVLAVARMTADRYAGTLADVLRLAVPPRHARVEAEHQSAELPEPPEPPVREDLVALWSGEIGGEALIARLAAGEGPRAAWTVTPGSDWPMQVAAAAAATLAGGRGSVICAPDARDVARVDAALTAVVGSGRHVILTADLGPAARYRAFLAVSRGQIPIVVGTRAAAFAPVRNLGLVAIWDDGDDLYDEPRAPYPHTREILLMRALHEDTAFLAGAHSRSVECQALVESRWAASLTASRTHVRSTAPLVHITGEVTRDPNTGLGGRGVRMPRQVFEAVRQALSSGPVLVHAPRYGYQPSLACDRCRTPATCSRCMGPLGRQHAGGEAVCRWCGLGTALWVCSHCGGHVLRFPVVGSLRTVEEWGRSFPETSVVSSGGDHVVDVIGPAPALVVATPGAEPRAETGYAAAVLLDTWLTLSRPGLRAAEEALRRWLNIASLVRAGADGGRVVAVGDPDVRVLQALVRWDPEGFAARELADRRSTRLPPAARFATVVGPPDVVTEALASISLPGYVEVLGPTQGPDGQARVVLRTSHERGAGMTVALQRLQAGRSSRKLPPVAVHVDPVELA